MKNILLAGTLCLSLAIGFAVAQAAPDGKTLFARCSGCHGAKGEKYKSKAEADILKELQEYKSSPAGSSSTSVMVGIARSLSQEDMKALARYISQL